uniref:Centrosomal protein of 290kDa coiled-coil region domain-containing protein n=1 Tax=Ciona savignyi TaxID=51511 RepID=H2YZT7_CIOSA
QSLEEVNRDLSSGNRRLKTEMENAQDEMERMVEEYDKMRKIIGTSDRFTDDLHRQNEQLKMQLSDLREQVRSKTEDEDQIAESVNRKVEEWSKLLDERDRTNSEKTKLINILQEKITAANLDQDRIKVEQLTKNQKLMCEKEIVELTRHANLLEEKLNDIAFENKQLRAAMKDILQAMKQTQQTTQQGVLKIPSLENLIQVGYLQSEVDAIAQSSVSRLTSVPRHISAQSKIDGNSNDIITGLNEQLIQTLEELAKKDSMISDLKQSLESSKRKLNAIRHQTHLLYKDYSERESKFENERKSMEDERNKWREKDERDSVKLDEYQRLLDALKSDPEEMKSKLAETSRKVSLLRANEKSLIRRNKALEVTEAILTEDRNKLRNESFLIEKEVSERIGYLERHKEMSVFKLASLQNALEGTVPESELKMSNRKFDDLTKYRDLLQKENQFVVDNVKFAGLQLTRMNMEGQKTERDLRDELSEVVPKSVSDADRRKMALLEEDLVKTKLKMSKLQDIAEISRNQLMSVQSQQQARERELKSLRQQLNDFQQQTDEHALIGQLHHQVLTLQASEAEAERKLNISKQNITKFKAQVFRAEKLSDEKDDTIYLTRTECNNKIRNLRRTIQSLRQQFSGALPLAQQEKFATSMMRLREDKRMMQEEIQKMRIDRGRLEDQLMEVEVKSKGLDDLRRAIEDKRGTEQITEWCRKMDTIRLQDMKLQRQVTRQNEQIAYQERLNNQHEVTISGLEEDIVQMLKRDMLTMQNKIHVKTDDAFTKFKQAATELEVTSAELTRQKESNSRAPATSMKNLVARLKEELQEKEKQQQQLSHALKELRQDLVQQAQENIRAASATERDAHNVTTLVEKKTSHYKDEIEDLKDQIAQFRRNLKKSEKTESTLKSELHKALEDGEKSKKTQKIFVPKNKKNSKNICSQKQKNSKNICSQKQKNSKNISKKLKKYFLKKSIHGGDHTQNLPSTLEVAKWDAKKQWQNKVETLKTKLQEKENAIVALEKQVQKNSDLRKMTTLPHNQVITEMKVKNEKLSEQLEAMQKEILIAGLRQEKDESMTSQLQERENRLQGRVLQLASENTEMQFEIEQIKLDVPRLKERVDYQQRFIDLLKSEKRELEQRIERIKLQKKNRIDEMTQQIGGQLSMRYESKTQSVEKLVRENEKLRKDLDRQATTRDKIRDAKQNLQVQHNKLLKEFEEIKKKLLLAESKAPKLNGTGSKAVASRMLESKLRKTESELEKKTKEVAGLKGVLEDQRDKEDQLVLDVERLQEQ